MTSESGTTFSSRPWTLLLGPGPALNECLAIFEALAQSRSHGPSVIEQLEDWSELFCDLDEVGQMLVDADSLKQEHLGLIQAFLRRFPKWSLTLLGRETGSRALRDLLHLPQARWIPAPLDMDSVGALLTAPGTPQAAAPTRTPRPMRSQMAQNGDLAGNIPDGYVTRSAQTAHVAEPAATSQPAARPTMEPGATEPQSFLGDSVGAPAHSGADQGSPAPSSGSRTGQLDLDNYEIPRTLPHPIPEEDYGNTSQWTRAKSSQRKSAPEQVKRQATEQQLLAEVERILVGEPQQDGGIAVAAAPAPPLTQVATIAPAAPTIPLEAPLVDAPLVDAPLVDTPLADAPLMSAPELLEVEAPVTVQVPTPTPAAPAPLVVEQPAALASPAASPNPEVAREVLENISLPAVKLEPAEKPSPGLKPAPYFKHQIADLADIVQCVDMGLDQAAEDVLEAEGTGGARLAARFEQLSGEVARLRQYTRTLSFMAAPPRAGEQKFDLAPMLEEMLTTRRSSDDAPRYLIRTPEPLPLRSDKLLLSQALDALLFLCHACAGPEGTVRVDGRRVEDQDTPIQISIRFPAGQLSEMDADEIVQPYALRRCLPELGPNSLAAAAGIIRGQGGSVELRKEPRGGLEWLLRMPVA